MNLPGDPQCDLLLPWASKTKLVNEVKTLAALLVTYVDDMRTSAVSEEDCWKVIHHVSSRMSYLGIQFAARKTQTPSSSPGPWAGLVVIASGEGVGVCVTQEKWDKNKKLIFKLERRIGIYG